MSKKVRNTNVEWVRLFAIVIVIFNHYSLLGGFEYDDPLSANAIIVQFLHFGGKLGVNLFIFISGFYLSANKGWGGVRHIVKFVLEVTFYSIIFASIGIAFNTLSFKQVLTMLVPIPFSQWNFVTCYFMVICLSFWTNKLIWALTEKQYRGLLIFLGITYCIIPTFIDGDFAMSMFSWYMFIYLCAGYFRKNFDKIVWSAKKLISIAIISILLIFLSEIIMNWVGLHISFVGEHAEHFRSMNSVLVLSATVSLVLGVLKLPEKNNRFIQTIASTTLGVFLIHDNKAMIPLLWTGIFHTDEFTNSKWLLLHAIGTCFIILVVCIIIDLIRQKTIGKLEDKLLGRWIEKVDSKLRNYLS